jgi:heme oxygenase (biliverdin-IX-beta and delta-forming)
MTVPLYRRRIGEFYGFYAALEPLLLDPQKWRGTPLADTDRRRKTPALADDLHALDIDPSGLAVCKAIAHLTTTEAQRYGCLYVMEGSTLGGQLISRHLHARLGIDPDHGGRFFHGYGARTGSMWKVFRSALVAYADQPVKQVAVIAAAGAAFRALSAWCSEPDSA